MQYAFFQVAHVECDQFAKSGSLNTLYQYALQYAWDNKAGRTY